MLEFPESQQLRLHRCFRARRCRRRGLPSGARLRSGVPTEAATQPVSAGENLEHFSALDTEFLRSIWNEICCL